METTRHFTATAIIVYQQKVLLHWHKKLDMWLPVGGHLERDELPTTAVIREAKEESGLDIEIYDTDINMDLVDARQITRPTHILLETIQPGHEHIDFVYFACCDTNVLNVESNEKTIYKWCDATEIEQLNMKINVKRVCLDALNSIYN